jgi:Holliday junction resolvase RusA-like endonuclease
MIWVPGVPVAQGRPRAFKDRAGNIRVYNPDKATEWKQVVASYAQAAMSADGWTQPTADSPIHVDIVFLYRRPKSARKRNPPAYKTTRPDRDNLEKAILDALKWTGVFHDDSQVVRGSVWKVYADRDGAWIRILTGPLPVPEWIESLGIRAIAEELAPLALL